MPFATVRDVRLCYEVAGEGPPLLWISGTGSDLRRRPNVLDGPMPEHFTVLAYDHRHLGRSDKPDEPCTMADYADDAAGLLDALGWSRCHVVGVSFGGMVAQELAVRHPERIDRLVLACTSTGGAGGSSYPLHELQDLPDDERRRRQIALSDTRVDEAWQRAHPEETARLVEQRQAVEAVGRGEPGRAEGARRQLAARRSHDVWDRLPAFDRPVLVCGGRYDGIAPPANLEALAARLPNTRLELFEGGHLFLQQDRAALPAVVDFLTGAG